MKRKSLLLFVSMACISVMLAACTGDVSAEVEPADEEVVLTSVEAEPEAGVAEIAEADAEVETEVAVEAEPEPEPEPEVDPNVELTMKYLEVSEDWLKDYEGVGLKRDGKLFSLTDGVPAENRGNEKMGYIYGEYGSVYGFGDAGVDRLIMDDRFVIPAVSSGEDVAWYGESVPSVTFVPVEFYGYSVNAFLDTDVCETLSIVNDSEYSDKEHLLVVHNYKDKGFSLSDSAGNAVSDMRSLYQGETYTAKWNDNGEQECELVANWQYYKADESGAITIETIPTDDPEVTKIDLSSLPKGTYYMVESYAMVTIE